MPHPVPGEFRKHSRYTPNFGALYTATTILTFHWAIVLYINSSFLEQFISKTQIGLLYTASSLCTIILFLLVSKILRKLGNYHLALFLGFAEFAALIGMGTANSLEVALPFFFIHQCITPLILFNIDVFMERMIGNNEGKTGSKRGLLLTLMSLAGALSPLAAGYLVQDTGSSDFSMVYFLSAFFMVPFLLIIVRFFRTFDDSTYKEISPFASLECFMFEKDVRNVFFAQFLLQFFFAWMVIYTPLYLADVIGFSWQEIGIILFAGLMAYVFLEYPIGVLADTWLGEKEMMAFGFVIIAVSTSWFGFATATTLGFWMFIMFMTRVGASFIESTTESYFFKHTDSTNINTIGFYRTARPLAYVLGASLGSVTLFFLPFNLIFVVLGLLMATGLFFTMALKDTR